MSFDSFIAKRDSGLVKSDEECMTLALKLAERAKATGETPIGATISLTKAQFSEHSTTRSQNNPLNTAGMNVIHKVMDMLPHRVVDGILYCTVEPDPLTVIAAHTVGINEVVFGAYNSRDGFVSSKSRNLDLDVYNIKYQGGVLAEDCFELLPDEMKEYCEIQESI